MQKIHPVKVVVSHMVDDHHPIRHRMLCGVVVMVVGVAMSKAGFDPVSHFVLDLVGYFVHGLGCVPFIDYLIKAIE